jgi:hypothetical protein
MWLIYVFSRKYVFICDFMSPQEVSLHAVEEAVKLRHCAGCTKGQGKALQRQAIMSLCLIVGAARPVGSSPA